jgi:hypothetical protein
MKNSSLISKRLERRGRARRLRSQYLIKGLNDGDAEETRRAGGLSPFRGRIIAIGVTYRRPFLRMYSAGQASSRSRRRPRTYMSGSEKQILEKFWEFFEGDSRFITFNGRQFDGPFLMIRSAINGIVPKRDLVGYRYGFHPNCDLREALNFFGTTNARQFKFNLDLACKVFGVETSKGEGLDGRSVETWYRAGRHPEIADYCSTTCRPPASFTRRWRRRCSFQQGFRSRERRASADRECGAARFNERRSWSR